MSLDMLNISGKSQLDRAYLLPKKILWQGDGVINGDHLLTTEVQQVYMAMPKLTKLTNVDGKKGAILLDFGSEIAGGIELLVGGVSDRDGVKVRVRFGESVSEAMTPCGEKDTTNEHAARDITVLLPILSQELVGNTGYRFVYLELEEENTWIDFTTIRGVLRYRDIPYLGSFECNDELLNQIYKTCVYTVHLNMQELLWDGIKRDRMVWYGDMHPEMLVIRSVFGHNDVLDDSLRYVPFMNPLPQWPNLKTVYGYWYLLILWDWYFHNGKKELVFELKEYWLGLLKQFMELIHIDRDELLDQSEYRTGFMLDWQTSGTDAGKTGVYALLRLTLLASAKLCDLVGEKEQQEKCLEYADIVKKHVGNHHGKKSTIAMLYLADMMSDKEEVGALLTNGNGRGLSPFMSYYILSAVAETVGMKAAQSMFREYYGAMLKVGATTFWEDFDLDWMREGASIERVLEPGEYDILAENGQFCYKGLRHSLCHGWSGGPAAFVAEQILGVQILEPGCKKVSVKPNLGDLAWVRGTYPTPYGVISVYAKQENGEIITEIEAPEGVEIVQ